jgi:hypothetical protein
MRLPCHASLDNANNAVLLQVAAESLYSAHSRVQQPRPDYAERCSPKPGKQEGVEEWIRTFWRCHSCKSAYTDFVSSPCILFWPVYGSHDTRSDSRLWSSCKLFCEALSMSFPQSSRRVPVCGRVPADRAPKRNSRGTQTWVRVSSYPAATHRLDMKRLSCYFGTGVQSSPLVAQLEAPRSQPR